MDGPEGSSQNGIAIVGMAGRFPGAEDVDRFWANLVAGVESISFFSAEELWEVGVEPELLADPSFVPARAVIDGAELFDAALFGFSPREAEVIDPQQRLLLECAWEALEHAGYDPRRFRGPIGVFAGAGFNTYLLSNLQHNPEVMGAVGSFQALLGSGGDFLATRISYKLGLRGPSLTVQTACSTSLVAVHLAVQSLLNGECDMALAGGVRLLVPRRGGHRYQAGSIFSRDGHCRAFDAAATGTTDGEGFGLVVLKRLADAVAGGDHIHAVILGSAINNDGAAKMGYTVPSTEGQAEVIAMAQALAGIDAGTLGLIEAHGTGTPLGDPIEVAALCRVFAAAATPARPCALGSLKSNMGHLDAAAGIASLIKASLAVEHGLIPPSLHFASPNPQIDLASSPFYVPVQATPWPADGPRRAGVSSFGIGGTNAHVVLEEAPEVPPGTESRPHQLVVLSARSQAALERATQNLAEHLRRHPELDLADAAYTLQVGRVELDHRRILVCDSTVEAAEVLSALDPKRVLTRTREAGERAVFFLFPGQGSQHPGMGAELYRTETVFREQVDRCAEILRPRLGLDLRQALYPEGEDPEAAAARLRQTALAQPALFVVEHALARLWMSWGVRPDAMLGHSVGEYAAACLAGVFSLEEALRLVAERGRLMQEMPGGSMLTVSLPEKEVRPLLGGLSLAAVNGPSMCVVSGEPGEVEELAARLDERGVQIRRLHTSHAFHSAAMDPILDRFAAAFAGLRLGSPKLPFLSNLTGTWMRPEEAASPRYWVRHLRETVRFSDGLETLFGRSLPVFLEVGPGQALTALVRQHPKRPETPSVLASLPAAGDGRAADAAVLRTLGQLWLAGVGVDWEGFHGGGRRRHVPLPTYPFERERYWVEPVAGAERARRPVASAEGDVASWFWAPLWRQALPPDGSAPAEGSWLVFADAAGFGSRLAARLRERGREVVTVEVGERFQESDRGFVIRRDVAEDYAALLDRLAEQEAYPARIVHLWSARPVGAEDLQVNQELGFYSLLHLARSLGVRPGLPLHLGVVST
ncbi:MAG TPA: type I polyketide synthase, partial [Thermoanaerobaculia bacterium]